jgi:protoporphyrinogen oxidase
MRIIIIGAGPCGLGAAKRLTDLNYDDWILFEREEHAGGLAASFVDDMGFTWDIGGHVIFSHYREFDKMLEDTCGGEFLYHKRKSFVNVDGSWVPYPFQNNLRYLPRDKTYEALLGLKSASGGNPSMPFDEWMEKTFGTEIVRTFMRPYNMKVWATDPSHMSSNWIAERVSIVDFEKSLRSVLLEHNDDDWGPNTTFMFPLRGGTGEIFRRLAFSLPQKNLSYNTDVVNLDVEEKIVTLKDGSRVRYDRLISTMPLNELIGRAENAPDPVRQWADRLCHSGTYVVGCGFKTPLNDERCWMYFPTPDVPFNRVTNFAHYSPFNVPDGRTDRYCSYSCETSFSDTKPEEQSQVVQATWKGLYDVGVVPRTSQRASEYTLKVPYAYPVPALDRDDALRCIQPYLMKHGIYSRGRFGAWLYEIGNMDHSFKQGIDVIDHIVNRNEETEWRLK